VVAKTREPGDAADDDDEPRAVRGLGVYGLRPASELVISIDALQRRAPGPRVLAYLDQSALSSLVRDEEHGDLRDVLKARVAAGSLVCVRSHEHEDETFSPLQSCGTPLIG
jgi:hypothetical protein